jgi:hypothetical protein
MASTLPRGTIGSVASLLAAILYQGNPDRIHKLWNIGSTERYIPGRVSLVEQKLITLAEHPSSPPVFSGVRVTRSLILCVLFVRNSMNKNSMLHGEICVRSSSIENNTSMNIE